MRPAQNDIQDLFSMFHDFGISAVKYEKDILTLSIATTWSEMWEENGGFKLNLQVTGCNYLYCDYQESAHTAPFKSHQEINFDKIEYSTKDIETITSLNLSIQSYEFKVP